MYLRPMYLEPVEHSLCILHEDPAQDVFGGNPGAIDILLDRAMQCHVSSCVVPFFGLISDYVTYL